MADYFSGRVQSVVFQNEENSFCILRMVLDGDDLLVVSGATTVKGVVTGLKVEVGVWFGFEAVWVNDPKYGPQLDIKRAPVLKGTWTVESASSFLSANGVGSAILKQILAHVGEEDFLPALSDPETLEQVPGLTPFAAQHVAQRWASVVTYFKVLDFLADMRLSSRAVQSIWNHFGDEAEKVLSQDPWALLEIGGFSFAQAEEIASRLGLSCPVKRLRGAVLSALKNSLGFGHLFMTTQALSELLTQMGVETTARSLVEVLLELHDNKRIVIDKATRPGTTALYDPWCYEMERGSAEMLSHRLQAARISDEVAYMKALGAVGPMTKAETQKGKKATRLDRVIRTAIQEWGKQAHLQLSEDQCQGIYHALSAPVSILTGLPGTGKTSSLVAAVQILQDADIPFLLMAPTGIAAKNLSARTGAEACTVHRAFAARGVLEGKRERNYMGVVGDGGPLSLGDNWEWGFDRSNPHPAWVVFVDESSMLDQHLLYRILECTRPEARLVFIGDHAQLPSVGPGNVLRGMLASGIFAQTTLTQIFRQQDTSGIVYAAHAIHRGDIPELDKDFRFIPRAGEDEVLQTILEIAQKFYEARVNFQVMSPKHKGTVGVTNLNEQLRLLLNPKTPAKSELKIGDLVVREGDRIMVVQNDYKRGIFNGDLGKIESIDPRKRQVQVKIFGETPLLLFLEARDVRRLLTLAYCSTIHKNQGIEHDRVILPLVNGFQHQLQRNLLYTGITRARQQVVLVGHYEAMVSAIENIREDERATLFCDRLQAQVVWASEGVSTEVNTP